MRKCVGVFEEGEEGCGVCSPLLQGLTVKGVDVGIGYVGVHVGFVSATPPVQGH